ncbi:MAG: hypothetical protein JKX96_07770 [Acinetobacter sp.]|nr:hypothetical protein [Acinetobacter sp.]
MRVKKSDIKTFWPKKPEKKEEPASLSSEDKAEILAAIKDIKLDPVEPIIVEQKIPDEILEQQKAMIKKMEDLSSKQGFPTYHFEVHRNSEGFIKSVDAIPINMDNTEDRNIAKNWYKE